MGASRGASSSLGTTTVTQPSARAWPRDIREQVMDLDYASTRPRSMRPALWAAITALLCDVTANLGFALYAFLPTWWLSPGDHEANLGEIVPFAFFAFLSLMAGSGMAITAIVLGWRWVRIWLLSIFAIALSLTPVFVYDAIWQWIVNAHGLRFHE
jgi:hypothetical protein